MTIKNQFPVKLGIPDLKDNTKYKPIIIQSDKTLDLNLRDAIEECEINKSEEAKSPYIKIKPTKTLGKNYLTYNNKEYKLDNILLHYSPVHKIPGLHNHVCDLQLKFNDPDKSLFIFIPVTQSNISSSFFIDILNEVNKETTTKNQRLNHSFKFDDLIHKNGSYYYYLSEGKNNVRMKDLKERKDIDISIDIKDSHIFVYTTPVSIDDIHAQKIMSFRKYNYIQNEADESNIWYYKGILNAKSIEQAEQASRDYYLKCGESHDIEGKSSEEETDNKEKSPSKNKLLAMSILLMGLIIVPIFHIIGTSVLELDEKSILGLDSLPISVMFFLFSFYVDDKQNDYSMFKILNMIAGVLLCVCSIVLIYSGVKTQDNE